MVQTITSTSLWRLQPANDGVKDSYVVILIQPNADEGKKKEGKKKEGKKEKLYVQASQQKNTIHSLAYWALRQNFHLLLLSKSTKYATKERKIIMWDNLKINQTYEGQQATNHIENKLQIQKTMNAGTNNQVFNVGFY